MPRAILAGAAFVLSAFAMSGFAASAFAAGTPAPAAAPSAAAAKPAAAPAQPNAADAARSGEVWLYAKAADGAIGYNAKSFKMDPALGTVTVVSLVYLTAGGNTDRGEKFNFILSEDTVDCIGTQFKPISRKVYDLSGKPLTGGLAAPATGWSVIPPGAPIGAFRSVACSAATFSGAKQAPNLASAMKAMREIK